MGTAFLAGCQSGSSSGALGLGQAAQPASEAVRESELRAYCPPIALDSETAFYTTYESNAEGDPRRVVYQAAISETSRRCTYGEGAGTMTAAVAGKIVPGPRGRAGTINVPIRVVATRGGEVVYSKLFQHPVTVSDTSGATQFVFTDPNIVIPGGIDRTVRITIGFETRQAGR